MRPSRSSLSASLPAMQLVAGSDADKELREGRMTPQRAVAIVSEVTQGAGLRAPPQPCCTATSSPPTSCSVPTMSESFWPTSVLRVPSTRRCI